jgi:hypothetical protein
MRVGRGRTISLSQLITKDHDLLDGLTDDDHPQYLNATRHNIFDKFRDFIPWVSLDGFVVYGDTGYTVTPYVQHVLLNTGATADYDAGIATLQRWIYISETGKVMTVEFPIVNFTSITLVTCWLRLTWNTTDPPSETTDHIGFKIVNADLYASSADGTTQELTDTLVDLVAGAQLTRLKIEFTRGESAKFYVNDVLKATHSTNLPLQDHLSLQIQIRTGEAVGKGIRVGRILVEKVY